MKRWLMTALAIAAFPAMTFAQGFKNLDEATAAVSRGFSAGEPQPIIQGMSEGDQVNLQFPGLVDESGFFGRDQASFLLEKLFGKTNPSKFRLDRTRKVSSEGQYHITATWTIKVGGNTEERGLYITLSDKNGHWSVVQIRSADR